jgi:penicillin amidase
MKNPSRSVRGIAMKRWLLIILLIVAGIVGVAAGAGYLWLRHTLMKSLPRTSGEITVAGLRRTVEIIRDTYGVPHIYADNESDLYFGFGYAMAQDRFWQMEFYRRLGQGRLSEVFGRDSVEVDRYFRKLTAAEIHNEIGADLEPLFTSFTAGVNAYLESHRERLPIEFKILGYRPEPWDVGDYVSILTFVNWGLSMGWRVDLTAARILEKVGEARMEEAFPVWPDDAPLVLPSRPEDLQGLSSALSESVRLLHRVTVPSVLGGSNNWVVSGVRSVTGKPILANDPHLQLTNPSVWWEAHLVCPTIDVSGAAIPGLPGIIVGHNREVAWGITNVQADDVDFYIEKINPDNLRQYWFVDHWEAMRIERETIHVKDGDPIKMKILFTRHGPVIREGEKGTPGRAISARWAASEVPHSAKAIYRLLKARDISEVRDALVFWTTPGLNFVFADTQGNIGYWCCATIPIRSKGDGMLPLPGWTGEHEWTGYIPFEQRPHAINPASGLIATANNKLKIAGSAFPYLISHYWEPPDRITRIHDVLQATERLSVDVSKDMQQDVYSVFASDLTPILVRIMEDRLKSNRAREAREILSSWDYRMDKDSVGACLFEITYRKLLENVFKDELGDELFEAYLQTVCFPPRALRSLLGRRTSPWYDDVATAREETLDDMVERSVSQALRELEEKLGDDITRWTWGRIHTLTFEHVLGKKRPLHWIFNLGPYPVGGSHLTVNNGQYQYEEPYAVKAGPSLRMIVDLSQIHRSVRVLPTGESGHVGSRHHQDQLPLYLHGQYHPDWMDREQIVQHTERVLILKPVSESRAPG